MNIVVQQNLDVNDRLEWHEKDHKCRRMSKTECMPRTNNICYLVFSGFEQHHGEDEEEENIVPEEPEVKISREELLSRYQVRSVFRFDGKNLLIERNSDRRS